MLGGFSFRLNSKKLKYDFTINRKITRIVGDSATGKSTLVTTITDSEDPTMQIQVYCPYTVREISTAFTKDLFKKIQRIRTEYKSHHNQRFNESMRSLLSEYDDVLFFCDETFPYLSTDEFASFCKFTDSFFVICCRDKLTNIPCSYKEIYRIQSSGRYHSLARVYNDYESFPNVEEIEKVLTEDSGSGYSFYSQKFDCISANGKSNIVENMKHENYSLIIGDGAAIGSEISDIVACSDGSQLFFPESFEYVLLISPLFSDFGIADKIAHTEKYASGLCFTWEQYYTTLLMNITAGARFHYNKTKLSACYFDKCCGDRTCKMRQSSDKVLMILRQFIINVESLSENSMKESPSDSLKKLECF